MMNSLQFRLGAGLFVSLVGVFAILWWMTAATLRYLGEENLVEHMNHDSESIVNALVIGPDSRLKLDPNVIEPVYRRLHSGHYFRVIGTDGSIASASLGDQVFSVPQIDAGRRTHRIYETGPRGQPLLILIQRVQKQGSTVTVAVAEDLSPTLAKIAAVQQNYTLVSLLLLLLSLAIQWLILHTGFKPLLRIQTQLQDLENGKREQLDTPVPREVTALVDEINRLLSILQQRLQQSRNALGDLAHALKTPLTIVRQLAHEEVLKHHQELRDALIKQTTHMQRLMDRVLKRARLAGHGPAMTKFDAQRELPDLLHVLKRMYQDKNLAIELNLPPLNALPVDREDMLELAGNLIDNACKWARARIKVSLEADRAVRLKIEDDGPGVSAADLELLSKRGARLDESVNGYGLGLSIARYIAEQYGGRLQFGRSDQLGGFCVEAVLQI